MPSDEPLIGRDAAISVLDGALLELDNGGRAVIIRGEPGAGKTALLEHTVEVARSLSMVILRTIGVESETPLSFSGLHMLLRPVLAESRWLPSRQRDALLSAMGLRAESPDRHLIALAALTLVGHLAETSPTLLIIDDAHWLDTSTADVLAFVLRRLDADRVLALVVVREGHQTVFDSSGIPELRLLPLAEDDASVLLARRAPDLSPTQRRRVLAAASGNPLALIELPLALRDLRATSGTLPLTPRLERAFAARAERLPRRTRAVLSAAALNDGDQVVEALAASAAVLDEVPTLDDLQPAVDAGLVEVDGSQLRFRHPLVRSAIAQSVTVQERLRLHRGMAAALTDSPDRRAWHLGASVIGPDPTVAAELEEAAGRAERRGAHAAAAVAFERAAELAGDPHERGRLMLRSLTLAFELGRQQDVSRLLHQVDRLRLEPPLSWRRVMIREAIDETRGHGTVRQFVRLAADAAAAGEVALAMDAALLAALKAHWFNADAEDRAAVGEVVERLPVDASDPKRLAALSLATPELHGTAVIEQLQNLGVAAFRDGETLRLLGIALITIPEFETANGFLAAATDGLREEGRLTVLARALGSQAYAALFSGDFSVAEQAAEEGIRLTRETQQPRWEASCHIFLGHVRGLRGRSSEARELIAEGQRLLGPAQSSPGRQHVELARAATSLAAGEALDAYDRVARIFEPDDGLYYPLIGAPGLADLVEAALATSRADEARAIVALLRPMALRAGSPFLRTAVADASAVLADDDSAEVQFRTALANRAGGSWRQARMNLQFGAWLRRQRRPADARGHLRLAADLFATLDMTPWADRALVELRATGETVRRRVVEAREELTPQERQIALMAAQGMSNRDIAQRLFLSHRTVGSHLYHIFPKLGVASRAELRRALSEDDLV